MEEYKRTETEFVIMVPEKTEMTEEEAFRGINIGMCYIKVHNLCSETKV